MYLRRSLTWPWHVLFLFTLSSTSSLSLLAQGLSPYTPATDIINFNGQAVAVENASVPQQGATGYSYVRALTIARASNTTQTSFPVLFSGTLSSLKSVANGGHVRSPAGYDVVFCADSACETRLNWEVENYNPATGTFVYWIGIPSLPATGNTKIYMFYGDAAVTSDQSTPTLVWDKNYSAVYHFSSGNGTVLSTNDSTVFTNYGTANGSVGMTTKIGGAAVFNGSSITIRITNFPPGTYQTTTEGWFNLQALPASESYTSYLIWFGYAVPEMANSIVFYSPNGAAPFNAGWDSYALAFTPGDNYLFAGTTFQFGQWHHIATTWVCQPPLEGTGDCAHPGFSGSIQVFVDGQLSSSEAPTDTIATDQALAEFSGVIGAENCGQLTPLDNTCNPMIGSADEVRVSAIARSADWIQTEYRNMSNPGGFVTIGAEAAY